MLPHLNGKGLFLGAIAVIMVVQGCAFTMISLFLYLQIHFSAIHAGLLVAALLLSCAVCFAFWARCAIRRYGLVSYHRPHGDVGSAEELVQPVKEFLEVVVAEMEGPVKENPKIAIALAGLVGYLAGDFYQRRR